jgi:pyrimidine-nucleoside phosphorylase
MESLVELIAKKRDGGQLEEAHIRRLLAAHADGSMPDYQMSALLMAIYFQGMNDAETVALTEGMLHSGDVIDLGAITGAKVDKHSTGGVGDKVSLCLAPLVAACGVYVPMVSGRGLGHTGGTLDKLEAIPGFRVDLEVDRFCEIVGRVGTCMIGQTARIAPADKRRYALRDVTGTVESIPLIVASILSKKLAEGIDALVLDVKVGRGAFMKTPERARELAEALVRVGTRAGKRVTALLTDMGTVLGRTIGNANETAEAIDVLRGGGPPDLVECTLALGAEMLVLGGAAADLASGRAALERAIGDGRGARTMERMIEAQGGDPSVVEHPERLPQAPEVSAVLAEEAGFVAGIDPLGLGLSAVQLGAGRTRSDQQVDHRVGVDLEVGWGDPVREGEALARIRAKSSADARALSARVRRAFEIRADPPPPRRLLLDRVGV